MLKQPRCEGKGYFPWTGPAETGIQEDHTHLLEKFIAEFPSQFEAVSNFDPFSCLAFPSVFLANAHPIGNRIFPYPEIILMSEWSSW